MTSERALALGQRGAGGRPAGPRDGHAAAVGQGCRSDRAAEGAAGRAARGERAAAGARALLLSGGGRPGRESGQGGALALGRDFFPTTVTLGRDTWAQ
jgi:hypothetical protein